MSKTIQTVEELDAVLHWRGKHAQAIRERDALQARLTAADEELDQCRSMALMIEEREWAEHVGAGPISSRVESAFTQMHNELSEARQGLTAADERADVMATALNRILHRCQSFVEGDWAMAVESVEAVLGIAEAALKPAEDSKPSTCTWSEGGFSWRTGCGKEWQFTDGGLPAENGMHFCHSCGQALVVASAESA